MFTCSIWFVTCCTCFKQECGVGRIDDCIWLEGGVAEFPLDSPVTCISCSTHPAYLRSLLNYHTPTRSLRSANTNLLSAPRVRTTFASRGFSVAAAAVWNSLLSDICDSSSTHTFRRLLKTHCFQQAFGSPRDSPKVPQIRPLADTVHSKYSFTYLPTYLLTYS